MSEVFLHLQRSEANVATIAATVFAAYVGQGLVDDGNEDRYIDKAAAVAIKLVLRAERAVKSDEEWTKPAGPSGAML